MIEKEYGINTKPVLPGNPQAKQTTERIYQVQGNVLRTYTLHETYVDDADPWIVILSADYFPVCFTYHKTKDKIPGQLVFVWDMILLINHIADCKYIRQR